MPTARSSSVSRRKCLIGAALVAEIVLFSAVTFVIAYVNSLNAIHHASQQLADSMVDTVAVRVTGYVNTTEQSLRNLAVTRRDAMLPEDYGPGGPEWSTEWTLALRSVLMAMQYDVYAFAMMLNDASLVSASMVPHQPWVRENVIDARTLPAVGYRNVTVKAWVADTKALVPPSAYTTEWPDGRDYMHAHASGYYALNRIFGTSTPWCAWTIVYLDAILEKVETCFSCSVVNSTGAFLGQLAVVRDVDAFAAFLKQAAVTPNTAIFMVDESLYLTAASTAAPTTVIYPANATVTAGPGCLTSRGFTPNATTIRVGCRASVHDYPYEPLNSLAASDLDLLQSSTRRSAYRQLTDSMAYYIVSLPVVNSGFKRSLHLVLFLPQEDVLTGVQQGLVLAIAMCVTLCAVGALLSSFLVATLVGVPSRRPPGTTENVPPLSAVYDAYTDVVTASRAYDRVRAPSQLQIYPDVPQHSGNGSGSSSGGGPLQGAVLLLVTTKAEDDGDVSYAATETTQSSSAMTSSKSIPAMLHECALEHGCSRVRFPVYRNSLFAALWHDRCDGAPQESCQSGDADHPELRALLCGLALLRQGCASAAVVVRGDVLRYHSDPFRHGTLLQDAEALLLATAGAGLLASDNVLQQCPSGVVTTVESAGAPGCRAVIDVASDSSSAATASEPKAVHFAGHSASVNVLLHRARSKVPLRDHVLATGTATPATSTVNVTRNGAMAFTSLSSESSATF